MAHFESRTLDVAALDVPPALIAATPSPSGAALELARRFGLLLPVVVRRRRPGRHEVIANLQSVLCARSIGMTRIPATVLDDVDDATAATLVRGGQRENVIARAERYRDEIAALDAPGAVRRVAARNGVARASVAHALRLLGLPDVVREALAIGVLCEGHGKALLACHDERRQHTLAVRTIEGSWSVRRLERAVRDGDGDADIARLERRLAEQLGVAVQVDAARGTLTLDYGRNHAVLDGVLDRLGYRP